MSEYRILNIGCGSDTYGTDFCDLYPQRKEVKKYNANTDRLPYADKTFDEVYSGNIFEHLSNPANMLEESWRVLKDGGKLTLITDNASFIFYAFNGHNYTNENKNDRHYALFTEHHLRNWAKDFGFHDATVKHIPPPFDWNMKSPGFIIRALRSLAMGCLPYSMQVQHLRLEAIKVG